MVGRTWRPFRCNTTGDTIISIPCIPVSHQTLVRYPRCIWQFRDSAVPQNWKAQRFWMHRWGGGRSCLFQTFFCQASVVSSQTVCLKSSGRGKVEWKHSLHKTKTRETENRRRSFFFFSRGLLRKNYLSKNGKSLFLIEFAALGKSSQCIQFYCFLFWCRIPARKRAMRNAENVSLIHFFFCLFHKQHKQLSGCNSDSNKEQLKIFLLRRKTELILEYTV